jgi:hypothetical protein
MVTVALPVSGKRLTEPMVLSNGEFYDVKGRIRVAYKKQ